MSKTILITGGNRGIGLELAVQFKKQGHEVIVTCRKPSHELSVHKIDTLSEIDVTNEKSLEKMTKALSPNSLDIIINNAGILHSNSLQNINIDEIRAQFEINSLGPLRVTQALLPILKDNSKVGIITSRMGSITDNTSGGSYGYRMSKAAANMVGVSLAHDLRPRGIAVALLHPGYVRTEMTHYSGLIDPPESAAGLIKIIDELTLENSGLFWHTDGTVLPW